MQALEPGLDDLPLRGVHHKGHFGDFRLTRQQLQVATHCCNAIDHALVHADVENVGAIFDLLPGYADCVLVFAFLDQFRELRRTGHIRPFTNNYVDGGLLGKWLGP